MTKCMDLIFLQLTRYYRFMRHVKKVNPEKRCFLQYDKLFIDGKVIEMGDGTPGL